MPTPVAVQVRLSGKERGELEKVVRKAATSPRMYLRAKVVLLAGDGYTNTEISRKLDYHRNCVVEWRRRFAEEGIAGLRDRKRSGRPRVFSL